MEGFFIKNKVLCDVFKIAVSINVIKVTALYILFCPFSL